MAGRLLGRFYVRTRSREGDAASRKRYDPFYRRYGITKGEAEFYRFCCCQGWFTNGQPKLGTRVRSPGYPRSPCCDRWIDSRGENPDGASGVGGKEGTGWAAVG